MIAEVIRSVTSTQYQVKDLKTLLVTTAVGGAQWRPGDRVIVIDSVVVGKASDTRDPEIVRV